MANLLGGDFEPEPVDEWQGYLTDEQFQTVDNVLESITSSSDFQFHLILGVAGTGKTQVLLSLAQDLRDNNFNVVHEMSTPLREYLKRARVQFDPGRAEIGSVILLDDPLSHKAIYSKYKEAIDSGARALVVAADPFQFQDREALLKFAVYLHPELSAEEYRKTSRLMSNSFPDVVYSSIPTIHWIRTIFRQHSKVGELALEFSKRIFDTNNPWDDKPRQNEWGKILSDQIDRALVDVEYANPGGDIDYIETQDPLDELNQAITRHSNRTDKWERNHSFLLVCDSAMLDFRPGEKYFNSLFDSSDESQDEPSLEEVLDFYHPESFQDAGEGRDGRARIPSLGPTLREIIERNGGASAVFDKPQNVRGVEYQEVIIHLPRALFKELLTGEKALDRDKWDLSRSLHTFLTRAKDKITIIDS